MPIDPNIITEGIGQSIAANRRPQESVYERVARVKAMQDEQKMRGLQMEGAQLGLEQHKQDFARQQQFDAAMRQGASPEELQKIDPMRLMALRKSQLEQATAMSAAQLKQLELVSKQAEHVSSVVGSALQYAPGPERGMYWAGHVVPKLKAAGVPDSEIPQEAPDDNFIKAQLYEGLTGKQQVDAQREQAQQIFQQHQSELEEMRKQMEFKATLPGKQADSQVKQAEAGQVAQYGMTLKDKSSLTQQQATAAETARHNKTSEAQGAQRLGLEKQRLNATLGGVVDGSGNATQAATNPVAKAIANYQVSAPSARALSSPGGQALMRQVMELNPEFRADSFPTIQNARRQFTTGKQGVELNAINTALGHIGALDEAYRAMKNGDIPVLNQIANAVGVQTGKDPVTTFRIIRSRVAPELVKAYAGGSGGQEERLQAAKDFNDAASPDQSAAAIKATAKLLDSKISALEHQWQEATKGAKVPMDFFTPEAKAVRERFKTAGGSGGTVRLQAPDGSVREVPAEMADHYMKRGAKKVQ